MRDELTIEVAFSSLLNEARVAFGNDALLVAIHNTQGGLAPQ